MGALPKIPGIVYRAGSASPDNCTPRPGKDTAGEPGRAPGLSTFETLNLELGEKAQMIDLGQIGTPVRGIPDDPCLGGRQGHVSIVPVDGSGNVDYPSLQDWAAARGTGSIHPFTQMVRNAIIQELRGKS
jgi:hypothetical protein